MTIKIQRRALGLLGAGLGLALAGGLLSCGSGTSAPAGTLLPDSAFQVEWLSLNAPKQMKPGEVATVQVSFRNASDITWPDPKAAEPAATGAYAVRLAWRWRTSEDMPPGEGTTNRVDLAKPVGPGETATLSIDVTAPTQPGQYTLQLDLVQEMVSWFEAHGAAKQLAPVTVQ
ncbi:MAG TPA: hypothetical protein VN783_00740 [Thermoanaerobaculia bacterium]|nr:hypothetical protein [Thermoanaerobaculia bacterium]